MKPPCPAFCDSGPGGAPFQDAPESSNADGKLRGGPEATPRRLKPEKLLVLNKNHFFFDIVFLKQELY